MTKPTFTTCTILLFLISCHKEKLGKFDGITIPTETLQYDVNSDGIDDFKIEFRQFFTKDDPVSYSHAYASIFELNSNLLLHNWGTHTFSLQKGDTIKRPEVISLKLYPNYVIEREWQDGQWDEQWIPNTSVEEGYYLGYVLNNVSENNLGWMQFEINVEKPEIKLTASNQTSDDFIVIPN